MPAEAYLGLVPSALALLWAGGLAWRGKARSLTALTVYLVFTSLSGVALQVIRTHGFFGLFRSVRTAYSFAFFTVQLVALALVVSAFLELATLHLDGRPRFQAAGHRAARLGLMAAGLAAVGVVFVPEPWIAGWRAFHHAQSVTFGLSMVVLWALFWLGTRYFHLRDRNNASWFGWILAVLGGGEAILAVVPPAWAFPLGLGLTIVCYSAGAYLAWRSCRSECPADSGFPGSRNYSENQEVQAALDRLDRLDGSFDSL
ncbi:MAG: hypothetical protein GC160_01345 [Acidobacteria bacterium]|nr:hypothetical protein [Acidobacteriota bacterium]